MCSLWRLTKASNNIDTVTPLAIPQCGNLIFSKTHAQTRTQRQPWVILPLAVSFVSLFQLVFKRQFPQACWPNNMTYLNIKTHLKALALRLCDRKPVLGFDFFFFLWRSGALNPTTWECNRNENTAQDIFLYFLWCLTFLNTFLFLSLYVLFCLSIYLWTIEYFFVFSQGIIVGTLLLPPTQQ